jgi:hypothetical protein
VPAQQTHRVASPGTHGRTLPDPSSKRQRKKAAYRERLAAAKTAKQTSGQGLPGQWRITHLVRKDTLHVGEEIARPLVGQSCWRVFDPDGNEVTLDERSLQDRASEKMARGDFQGALADSLAALKQTLQMTEPPRKALGETFDALPPGNSEVDW